MGNKLSKPDCLIVAEEFNKCMDLRPPIDVEAPEIEIRAKIREAFKLLVPEDELTDFTKNYLEKNGMYWLSASDFVSLNHLLIRLYNKNGKAIRL